MGLMNLGKSGSLDVRPERGALLDDVGPPEQKRPGPGPGRFDFQTSAIRS